ncbi:MAG: hypothetical protein JO168_21750 [Solirubrobacterales bacterium]|nr:hypothetical protein [Solirubrobacterales bacterium]
MTVNGAVAAPDEPVAIDDRASADGLNATPEVGAVMQRYSVQGEWLQLALRGLLAVFVVCVAVFVTPVYHETAFYAIAIAYAVWATLLTARTWRHGPTSSTRLIWVELFVDLGALGALTLIAGASAKTTWTQDVLVRGFYALPLLAATQLRPRVSALLIAPTVAVYFFTSVDWRLDNDDEPWGSILLRTLILVAVGVACIILTYIQRSRVATIGRLYRDRSDLLGQLTTIEDRERRGLAESLHDGALQYILAARHDLEDARELGDPEAFQRLERALSESGRLLRSTVAELHPAVLQQAGLAHALRDLVRKAEADGSFMAELDVDGWSNELRTPVDVLLYATARELIRNVVKHARAQCLRVSLRCQDGTARLVVEDDGQGIPDGAVERSLSQGHIGVASYRVKVEAAGGAFTLAHASPRGTLAEVVLPCR